MIMTEITGAVPAGTYFPEERRYAPRTMGPDFGKEVAAVLARLHTATRTGSTGPAVDRVELVRKSYAEWRKVPQQPFSLAAEMAYAWLFSHPLPPNRPHCLTHGDVGVHNLMVRDGHLAALLDWELAHPGDPAEDLAQCRMMLLPDVMPWEDFVREYVAAGGDPQACEANSVAHYCVWTYLKHGLMNATLREIYLSGARDDVIAASVAGHYYYRLLVQYQARALQIAVDASRG
jgi:thiamine kinase-like enzyme